VYNLLVTIIVVDWVPCS